MKLIHYAEPLLLIGVDVLSGGQIGWTYRAMGFGAGGKGMIIFANGKCTVSLPLINVPVLGRPRFVSPPHAAAHTATTTAGVVPHCAAPKQIAFIRALACQVMYDRLHR